MSLRTLLTLMALVSASMIAAVIYTKVINPPARYEPTVGELQALKRVCEAQCEHEAPGIVAKATSRDDIARLADECLVSCVNRALNPVPPVPGTGSAKEKLP